MGDSGLLANERLITPDNPAHHSAILKQEDPSVSDVISECPDTTNQVMIIIAAPKTIQKPTNTHFMHMKKEIKYRPFHNKVMFFFSLIIRSGFSSRTSMAVMAALARYGGKEAEKTYPELLNRCHMQ